MFTGDLERKTYADVEAFLAESIPEGLRLDYKREVPPNIERTIAAMANSEGGVIVIGVDEDRATRKPQLPPAGIDLAGQAERVQSKAYQAIHEPITALDFGTFPFPDATERGVLVVRVHPSERAPHAVDQGRTILRRVGAQAMKEGGDLDAPMHLDRIGWLFERRQRNQQLIDTALARYESLLLSEPPPAGQYRFDIVAYPAVAHAEPLTVKDLQNLVGLHNQIGYNEFPVNWRSISGGIVSIQPHYWSNYCDVTGIAACTATWEIREKITPREIYGNHWFGASLALIKWVGMANKKSGNGGTIHVRARLQGVIGTNLVLDRGFYDPKISIQDEVKAAVVASVDDIASDPKPCIAELLSQLAEAFDRVIPIETMIKKLP